MHLSTFEKEIPKAILQCGKEYFSGGTVTDLQHLDNGQWFAAVQGNNAYSVYIRLDNDRVKEESCSCPFEGEVCKHIVAVLYQLREETASHMKAKEQEPWKKLVSVIPEKDLRQFLKEFCAKNKELRNALMIRFSGYDTANTSDKYRQIIEGAFDAAGDRHGYIDYYYTSGAMQPVFELLAIADAHIGEGNYHEAFYIASAVAPACIDVIDKVDDSDGECGMLINEAFDTVCKILQSRAQPSLQSEIFDWLLGEAGNPEYDDYGCADNLYPALIEAVDSPERASRVLTLLDDQLKSSASKEGWSKEYANKKYLQLRVNVFLKTGDEEQANKIIAENIHIHDFRKIMVERHLSMNDFDGAVRLIREGIGIATGENYPGIVINWKEMLLDIHKKQNNITDWRAVAKDLYYSGRFEMKYYREYKSTFKKEEWSLTLEKIIKSHTQDEKRGYSPFQYVPTHLAEIYIEEKMWPELFGLLKKNANIYMMNQYSQYLIKDFAAEMIPMYSSAICVAAEKASDRRNYQEIAGYLFRMSEIPKGKEPARLLADQLIEKNNRRPAMKDELGKFKDRLKN